jgi:excisionase family DNA binding protein
MTRRSSSCPLGATALDKPRNARLWNETGDVSDSASAQGLRTVHEVARFLQVHEKTLLRWVRSRGFPCVRVGTRLRFDPSDVLRWISARKEGG